MLPSLLKREDNPELVCRLTLFLIRVHHAVIVTSQELLKDLEEIQTLISKRIVDFRVKIFQFIFVFVEFIFPSVMKINIYFSGHNWVQLPRIIMETKRNRNIGKGSIIQGRYKG